MAITHRMTTSFSRGGTSYVDTIDVSASGEAAISEAVPANTTNLHLTLALDQSALKSFYAVSDEAVTIKTNSSSAPDDTLTLVAGVPMWWPGSPAGSCPITADVSAGIYVTNATANAATLTIFALQDATP